ncbi:FMN-binding protein [Alkalibaculum sp. M08DMB]|uniref:FMN-binding protein n=1 Tax=Alkalibaculum sporogenes TaxID=2655001 RepID=A0A6A7KCA4_9FIRM|nr:FMN-binding protein [Alkalibaculum sporogenes]
MKKILVLILAGLLILTLVSGCGAKDEDATAKTPETPEVNTPVVPEGPDTAADATDGTYTAEGEADTYGWKHFVELEISEKQITSVNFDYENAEGIMKSEDEAYAASMEATGTTPDVFIPELEAQLLAKQDISAIDGVSGATQSTEHFTVLVKEALGKAENK